ncbi:MAG TPA: AzlD domain-containing protein [Jiangellaceae bacterium]
MSIPLLIAVAAITIGSRVAALAVLPQPRGPIAGLARRLPAPLFAALAALSLTGNEDSASPPAMLAAVGCALAVALRWRSLLLILGAGLAGFLVASLIW